MIVMTRPWGALAIVLLFSGCIGPAQSEGDDGPYFREAEGIWFDWIDDEGGPHAQALTEESTMSIRGTMGHIQARDQGDEGPDFRLRLELRSDGTEDRLTYDRTLSRLDTFRFSYEESTFWSGRAICHVDEVSGPSFVTVDEWAPDEGRFAGGFSLGFKGSCDGGETHEVTLRNGGFR